jgi:hypothetical protein
MGDCYFIRYNDHGIFCENQLPRGFNFPRYSGWRENNRYSIRDSKFILIPHQKFLCRMRLGGKFRRQEISPRNLRYHGYTRYVISLSLSPLRLVSRSRGDPGPRAREYPRRIEYPSGGFRPIGWLVSRRGWWGPEADHWSVEGRLGIERVAPGVEKTAPN